MGGRAPLHLLQVLPAVACLPRLNTAGGGSFYNTRRPLDQLLAAAIWTQRRTGDFNAASLRTSNDASTAMALFISRSCGCGRAARGSCSGLWHHTAAYHYHP